MRFLWSCRVLINNFTSSIIFAILAANILFIIIILGKFFILFLYIYEKSCETHASGVVCDTLYKQCFKLYTGDQEISK